jgi:hypothetical protein
VSLSARPRTLAPDGSCTILLNTVSSATNP